MPLRVFNRAVMAHNLIEDGGIYTAEEYLSTFSQNELAQIYVMINFIQNKGPEAARNFATKDLELAND